MKLIDKLRFSSVDRYAHHGAEICGLGMCMSLVTFDNHYYVKLGCMIEALSLLCQARAYDWSSVIILINSSVWMKPFHYSVKHDCMIEAVSFFCQARVYD